MYVVILMTLDYNNKTSSFEKVGVERSREYRKCLMTVQENIVNAQMKLATSTFYVERTDDKA